MCVATAHFRQSRTPARAVRQAWFRNGIDRHDGMIVDRRSQLARAVASNRHRGKASIERELGRIESSSRCLTVKDRRKRKKSDGRSRDGRRARSGGKRFATSGGDQVFCLDLVGFCLLGLGQGASGREKHNWRKAKMVPAYSARKCLFRATPLKPHGLPDKRVTDFSAKVGWFSRGSRK